MPVQMSKTLPKGEVLFGRGMLVAKEDDLMVGQRAANFMKLFVTQWLTQIDAINLGAQNGR